MTPWTFTYSPAFTADLSNISAYIVSQFEDTDSAEKVLSAINNAIARLKYAPLRHPIFPECDDLSYRYVTAGKYVVIFRAHEKTHTVNILRVMHTHQDIVIIMKNK